VGKSGSGKTTFIRSLVGLEGKAQFAPSRPSIAAVFHAPLLFPWATLGEMVGLEEKARNTSADGGLFERALNAFALPAGILRSKPWEISQGMRQRFEVAKALAFRLDLILLDEAFSGIDAPTKADVFRFLDKYLGSGSTLLFVTHDLGDVVRLADRISLIEMGRVAATLEPDLPRSARISLNGGELIEMNVAKEIAARLF
jgi:ABC-type nitrate/sulfonate/bicarbonate transport system ATPase subunit